MGVSNIRMPFMADQDDSCFGWGMRGQRREVKREGKKTPNILNIITFRQETVT